MGGAGALLDPTFAFQISCYGKKKFLCGNFIQTSLTSHLQGELKQKSLLAAVTAWEFTILSRNKTHTRVVS